MSKSSWVACECGISPCVCYEPVPRIGPTGPAEARRLQQDMASTIGASSAWLAGYIETHGEELAAAMRRPVEELIQEALDAKQREAS